ncbi:helix-turn-helix domain-containing protein [Pseudonocardia lacus]|uniref:helix-turn-helix domain-containing protein n=1 Tax=Pseudonocardia lacus TaxID=2835865 RepID=UPI001BDD4FF8|nr:helix-turn-helix transcriptional regulator [Pseudonocardia lacus]
MDTAAENCPPGGGARALGASVIGFGDHTGASPMVLRLGLGMELRRRREAAGITVADAAEVIRASGAKISRMELGRVSFKQRDIADLLTLYRVDDPAERETFLDLARSANAPGWWQLYSDLLPTWFETYLGLEQAAAVIRAYSLVHVPGLLQTREYAQAVIGMAPAQRSSDIQRRVELRMRRQRILTRPDAPTLWALIDESALRRPVGGRAVARAQLAHLLEMNELATVTLQIIPWSYARHPQAGTPFTILRFPQFGVPDIVYQEHLSGAVYINDMTHVNIYRLALDRMVTNLDHPERTALTLRRIHDEM